MDVIIKNQDMPKCCYDCFALDDKGIYSCCLLNNTSKKYFFNNKQCRMDDCPLEACNKPILGEKVIKLSDLYQIIEPELTFEMLDKINNAAFVIND